MRRHLLLPIIATCFIGAPIAIHAQEQVPARLDRFGDPLPAGVLARLGTVRLNECSAAAYSPDGKFLFTVGRGGTRVWEAATGRMVRVLPGEKGFGFGAVGVILSRDAKKLGVLDWGGSHVQVWDLETYKKILVTKADGGSGGGDWGASASFSADGKTLYGATAAKLLVWDIPSGKKLKEFPFHLKDKPVDVRHVAFSEDGKLAATQGEKKVHLWDTQTGKHLHEIPLFSGGDTMRFTPDGKMLVVSGYRHWLSVFSVETGKKLHSIPVADSVHSLAFSRDGKTMAVASNATIGSSSTSGPQVIQVYDMANLKARPAKHRAPGAHFVTVSPDGNTLAWLANRTLCFMDRATGKDLRPIASHHGAVKALVYHPDGKRIISAGEDGDIRIWDATSGEPLGVLQGHVCEIHGLALFPNGKRLASCGQDGTFRLWDLEQRKSITVLKDEGNTVRAAAFSADGKRLASGGYRGVIFLRDPANGRILEEIETGSIASLAFSPDGGSIAAICDRRDLLIHHLHTKESTAFPLEQGGSAVAWSPDGKFIAGAGDRKLLLVNAATKRVLKSLPGHNNRRGCIAFSADSRYFVSVSDGYGGTADRTIRVFELATVTEIHAFPRESPIFAAAFSPDGTKLVVGGEDATAVVLDLRNLSGGKRPTELTDKQLAAHWQTLTAQDASKVYEARADLMHAPQSAVPFLARSVPPAAAIDVKRVQTWIKDLASENFKVRDVAFRSLDDLGDRARGPMRQALTARPALETQRRLQTLLDKLETYSPAQLRKLRAIEILEAVGTPEAIDVIERLAKGNPDALETTESRTVLARRAKSKAPLPEVPKPHVVVAEEIPPPGPVLNDVDGAPMPAGVIARLGTTRWRLSGEPRRILVSDDGKTLAVISSYAGIDKLDAQSGKRIEDAAPGVFTWGIDLRMALALSPDWRLAAVPIERVLAVIERGKKNVIIAYRRSEDDYPLNPEESEGRSSSWMIAEYLCAAEYSPDGKTLVGAVQFEWSRSWDRSKKEVKECHLIAWDAATGKELWKSRVLPNRVDTILFSRDGNTLTAVDQAGIAFRDARKGRELHRWASKDPLFCAQFSPDHAWLVTGSKDAILLWEVATGKVRDRLPLAGKEIKALAFSHDGTLLAGGVDKTIRLWNWTTRKPLGDCAVFRGAVETVAFSADGKTLFSGHQEEHVLRRWDVASREPVGALSGAIAPVRMLSFSRDSRTLLSSVIGDEFYVWETKTGKSVALPKKDDERMFADWLASSGQAALLRCEDSFGAQFAMLLTGTIDRLDQIPGMLGSSVDGQRVLIQSEKDKKPCLTVLKMSSGKPMEKAKVKDEVEREFVWRDGGEVHAALSPDGKTVAAAGQNVVCFFDVSTGKERRHAHPTNVKPELIFRTQSLKFSADGSRIALLGDDGTVRIITVNDGRRVAEVHTKSRGTTGMALSPDNQTLLTASFGGSTHAWEVATGQMIRKLGPGTYVYSPNNRVLARSAEPLRILDLYSGAIRRECKADGIGLGNFAFSPDSRFLAAICADTTILVWPIASDAKPDKILDDNRLTQVLEKGNATEAYQAIGGLIANPDRALAFLDGGLHAVGKTDAKQIQRLIAALAGDQADAAAKELARLGIVAEPALRAAAGLEKSPLAKDRIERLLRDLGENWPALSSQDIFHIRAIQALERIGSPQARQLLHRLGQGDESSPRTRAATDALRRLSAAQ